MLKEQFFEEVAKYLGEPLPNETRGYGRWRRGSGSGRFPGRGVIRFFNERNIHVILLEPRLVKFFNNPHTAIEAIAELV